MSPVAPIPADYPRLSPYLCVDGADAAIAFYCEVFGGTERFRLGGADGRVGHAEIQIGDSVLMLSDEWPDMGVRGPSAYGGTAVTLGVYVDDVDAVVADALRRGATLVRPVEDHFYGDRSGHILDPWGHRWSVATHIEDVAPDEMARRAAAMMG
jgi:PhnB protein